MAIIQLFRAPSLPIATKVYEEQATNQFAKVLRIYFNQLDELNAVIISTIENEVAFLARANVYTNVQAVTPYRANISGAVSINLATAASNNLHLTMTGNVTSFALTNPTDGADYSIRFIQSGGGGFTFAGCPSAFKFAGGVAPVFVTTAGAVNFLTAQYGSTEGTYMARFSAGMA